MPDLGGRPEWQLPVGPSTVKKDLHTMLVTGPCRQLGLVFGLSLLALTGCSPFRNAIPAECVRPNMIDAPRASREPINFTRLRQEPPAVYLLGPRDVLGVYIEGVLGKTGRLEKKLAPAMIVEGREGTGDRSQGKGNRGQGSAEEF